MKQEDYQKWQRVREKGYQRFVVKDAIVEGIIFAVIWVILSQFILLPSFGTIGTIILFIVSPLAFIGFNHITWANNEEKFLNYKPGTAEEDAVVEDNDNGETDSVSGSSDAADDSSETDENAPKT